MSKQEFLARLRNGLSKLPQHDREERLTFYSEMIDDRMEEGLSEEEAVCEIGDIDQLISQITADVPLEKTKSRRRLRPWEIILLVLGSPIWLSLLIAVFAVMLSLCLSLWAVFVSLAACALGGIVAGIGFACNGHALPGLAMIGAGMVCAGLSVFMFYACKAATKGMWQLIKRRKRNE